MHCITLSVSPLLNVSPIGKWINMARNLAGTILTGDSKQHYRLVNIPPIYRSQSEGLVRKQQNAAIVCQSVMFPGSEARYLLS